MVLNTVTRLHMHFIQGSSDEPVCRSGGVRRGAQPGLAALGGARRVRAGGGAASAPRAGARRLRKGGADVKPHNAARCFVRGPSCTMSAGMLCPA